MSIHGCRRGSIAAARSPASTPCAIGSAVEHEARRQGREPGQGENACALHERRKRRDRPEPAPPISRHYGRRSEPGCPRDERKTTRNLKCEDGRIEQDLQQNGVAKR